MSVILALDNEYTYITLHFLHIYITLHNIYVYITLITYTFILHSIICTFILHFIIYSAQTFGTVSHMGAIYHTWGHTVSHV